MWKNKKRFRISSYISPISLQSNEIYRGFIPANDPIPDIRSFNITGNVNRNQTAIVFLENARGIYPTGLYDSRGNIWNVNSHAEDDSVSCGLSIASSYVINPLISGDLISIGYTSGQYYAGSNYSSVSILMMAANNLSPIQPANTGTSDGFLNTGSYTVSSTGQTLVMSSLFVQGNSLVTGLNCGTIGETGEFGAIRLSGILSTGGNTSIGGIWGPLQSFRQLLVTFKQ